MALYQLKSKATQSQDEQHVSLVIKNPQKQRTPT